MSCLCAKLGQTHFVLISVQDEAQKLTSVFSGQTDLIPSLAQHVSVLCICILSSAHESGLLVLLLTDFPPSLSDDDIIFEDFARQRLIGAKDDKDEDEEPVDSPKLNDR